MLLAFVLVQILIKPKANLGLLNKKDLISNIIGESEIDIFSLKELFGSFNPLNINFHAEIWHGLYGLEAAAVPQKTYLTHKG